MYITPQSLPHRFSFSQDEGGYYNGISNTWFIPRVRAEEYIAQHPTLSAFPFTFTGNREPNYNSSKAGILYQITYPTGGSDEIEYSPNTYIDSEYEESYFPGLKVSRLTTNSLTSPSIVRNYYYTTLTKVDNRIIRNDQPSSVIIDRANAFVRRFFTRRQYSLSCLDIYYHNFSSNSRFDLNAFNGSPIAYSCVTEITGDSFVASTFNVSSDQLGYVVYGDESFLNPKENTAWDNGLELVRYYGTINNYLYYILKEQDWNYTNTIALATENCSVFKKYEAPGAGSCSGYVTYEPYTIISYNLWQNWYKLTSFTETNYNETNQNLTTYITNYFYDNATHGQITREETTDSKGDLLKRVIKYPSDINTGTYSSMASLNMHNYPIEQISYINNQINGSSLITYKAGGGSYVPEKAYKLEITTPLSSFTIFNGTTKDSHYGTTPEFEYINYDSKGNLTEYKTRDGITVSLYYILEYSDMPLIKAFNVTYSQLLSAVNSINVPSTGLPLPQSFENSGQITSSDIESVVSGIKSTYSANLVKVSGYTYKPLVGMSSETDTNGTTIHYEYDSYGRLKLAKDDDGNIVKRYSYNYAD